MIGAASLLDGATESASDDSCGRRKYMTVRIRRNVSSTNKIDMGVAPYFVRDMRGWQSRWRSTVTTARGVQIASGKGAVALKELAIRSGLGKLAVVRFAGQASRFAVLQSLLNEFVGLLQTSQQRGGMNAEDSRSVSLV